MNRKQNFVKNTCVETTCIFWSIHWVFSLIFRIFQDPMLFLLHCALRAPPHCPKGPIPIKKRWASNGAPSRVFGESPKDQSPPGSPETCFQGVRFLAIAFCLNPLSENFTRTLLPVPLGLPCPWCLCVFDCGTPTPDFHTCLASLIIVPAIVSFDVSGFPQLWHLEPVSTTLMAHGFVVTVLEIDLWRDYFFDPDSEMSCHCHRCSQPQVVLKLWLTLVVDNPLIISCSIACETQ